MKKYEKFSHFKQEEDFLNEMSASGHQFKSVDEGYYEFEDEMDRNFYRLAYISDLNEQQLDHLVEELKKEGIEIVCVNGIWAYFTSKEPFHIYSSFEEEKIGQKISKRYRRTGYAFLVGSVAFALAALVAGFALYLGMAVFCVIGIYYIYLSYTYEKNIKE